MDLLSGILLAAVTLFAVGFLIKETIGDKLVAMLKERPERTPPKAVNEYLIGSAGTIVENTGGDDAPMKVKIGIERWNAKPASADNDSLQVGTEIEVTAIDGLVLIVTARAEATTE